MRALDSSRGWRKFCGVALACLVAPALPTGASGQQKKDDARPSSRVQKKTYEFKDAGKEMEYALFVPSTYDKDKKWPLVIALHGLGGNPQQMMRSRGLTEQAEKYGYIVAAPMGYNSSGWYGSRGTGGGGLGVAPKGGVGTPPGTVLSPRVQDSLKLTDEQKKEIAELQKEVDGKMLSILTEGQNKQLKELKDNPGRGLGGGQGSPNNLGELSEKDVLNVLDIVKKDYTIDPDRIYLMGHSMGGGGTWHLGLKYPDTWAALAPIAPAIFRQPTELDKIKHVPVILVQGDQDTLVRPDGARRWAEGMKKLEMNYEYLEIAGGDHGNVVGQGMPKIFEFFNKHTRKPKEKPKEKGDR
jgi:poly(3-hydroxybutyrate) depolymerase